MPGVLKIGDRISLSGGYDMAPEWLGDQGSYQGVVTSFIPGQNEMPAAVVCLDESIRFRNVAGQIVVLELRYDGAMWGSEETVHIELCNFQPESKRWQDRRQGLWIESHASYEKI